VTARTAGREAEVALVRRALGEVAAPAEAAPRVVALSGEPGIGKSHLLAALAAAAAECGAARRSTARSRGSGSPTPRSRPATRPALAPLPGRRPRSIGGRPSS
jgi:hypothetical protein